MMDFLAQRPTYHCAGAGRTHGGVSCRRYTGRGLILSTATARLAPSSSTLPMTEVAHDGSAALADEGIYFCPWGCGSLWHNAALVRLYRV
jgi:hypothetical protein